LTFGPIEFNGYDETGTIGKYLRFTRVGLGAENELRPFIYNLLHFRSITTTKPFLRGMDDSIKIDYVRMILSDQNISVDQYCFSTDHQIDVLREFTLLEEKQLFSVRGNLIKLMDSPQQGLTDAIQFLKRYNRSPYWMECFVKSYGFRMMAEDLEHSSKILRNPRFNDYRVISYVDGGFPFVFWRQSFMAAKGPNSRFSPQKTPIYGVTKGDEYYPTTSMAGNIAFISNTVPGMIYPHNIKEIPRMKKFDLRDFYNEYVTRASVPTFLKRILFAGRIPQDLQYSIPYLLHFKSGYQIVYEPLRIHWKQEGSLKSFYRVFGRYPQNDILVVGIPTSDNDRDIIRECEDMELECRDASEFVDFYMQFLQRIEEESGRSNLSREQLKKLHKATKNSMEAVVSLKK